MGTRAVQCKLTKDMSGETPRGRETGVRVNQRLLLRQAIDACRQALYFVELIPVTERSHEYYAEIEKRTPRAYDLGKRLLVKSSTAFPVAPLESAFPPKSRALPREDESSNSPEEAGSGVAPSLRAMPHDEQRCREHVASILASVLADKLEDPGVRRAFLALRQAVWRSSVPALNGALTAFVMRYEPRHVRIARDAWSLFSRNMAFVVTLVAFGSLIAFVEQIRSLYGERKDYTFGLFVLVFAPAAILLVQARRRGRAVGVFRRLLVRPPAGFDLQDATGHLAFHVSVHYAVRALQFLAWLALVALAAFVLRFGLTLTVTWSLCLFAAVVTVARVIDAADWMHPAPVRLLLLSWITGLLTLYYWLDFSWWAAGAVLLAGAVAGCVLARFGRQALGALVFLLTVACVIAAGVDEHTENGEAWRDEGHVPERIQAEHWPFPGNEPVVVMIASGGGSRAAILTALTLERLEGLCVTPGQKPPCETLAQHLHAISAVSGGSLATASYVQRRMAARPPTLPTRIEDVPLPAALGDDFLRPVFEGMFHADLSRGRALEGYWETKLALGSRLGGIARAWGDALRDPARGKLPPFPVPLFNSASLDGYAVVVSPFDWSPYYDLNWQSARCFAEKDCQKGLNAYEKGRSAREGDDATWVYYREGVYDLAQLLPAFDPTLAQAVRASANFPFGFPVVQVETTRPLWYSPVDQDRQAGTKERVRLTDGGVLSNSGLWTAYYLLAGHAEALKTRGLLLVMVDASYMPEYGGRTRTRDLLAAIGDQTPIAANLHVKMLELLKLKLGGKFAAVEVSLPARSRANFYTSWALDRGTQDRLHEALELEMKATGFDRAISEAWRQLQGDAPVEQTLARFPLD
jgi:hypothetical protein